MRMVSIGVLLLVLGAVLAVAEGHLPAGGALGAPGVLGIAGGTWVLIATAGGSVLVAATVATVLLAGGAAALALTVRAVRATDRRALPSGTARLRGTTATVRSWSGRTGQVAADGTLWRARWAWPQDEPDLPQPDHLVVIERVDNLTLLVRPAEPWELE